MLEHDDKGHSNSSNQRERDRRGSQSGGYSDGGAEYSWRARLVEGSATALGSVTILALAGFSYHVYYKRLVLRKMELAFEAGYSTPELVALSRHVYNIYAPSISDEVEEVAQVNVEDVNWISRTEQPIIDAIVDGSEQGSYYLITGEKGTGKTSMVLDAIRKVDGDGVAMIEANSDLEVFRLRLGKALNYEFHEDYIGSLFSFKGPRDATPLLDIERAFNKMEKIALRRRSEKGRPLLLIINRSHLLHDNDPGRHLLEVIQQRAELWAASCLVTVVFISDEYWIEERLRPQATRMRVFPVHDIPKAIALSGLKAFRAKAFGEDVSSELLDTVYRQIGGRLRFLNQVAKSVDMKKACKIIVKKEKQWFLNQCWIYGKEMDDAVEEAQDFAAAAMILAKVLVDREKAWAESGKDHDGRLPEIPLHEVRQIMTRGDFIQGHDHINIFSIDSNSMVRADSVAMQNAFRLVCEQEGFEEHLNKTIERLDELESLGRTREIKFKDINDDKFIEAVLKKLHGKKDGEEYVLSLRGGPPSPE